MVRSCCVPQCSTHAFQPGISFHRFPCDKKLAFQWISKLRVGKNLTVHDVVCGRHFSNDAYKTSNATGQRCKRSFLKPNALPSENLPKGSHHRVVKPRTKLLKGDGAALLGETRHPLKATKDILFICCFCTYITTDERGITSHLVAHGEEKFVCQQCRMSFSSMSRLCRHIQSHTEDESVKHTSSPELFLREPPVLIDVCKHTTQYKCQHCPQSFKEHRSLTNCIRTHSDRKPYKCKQCPKAFAKRSSLIWHTGMHTGEKRYRCQLCPDSFQYKKHLTSHVQTHTGEKPYKCQECPKAFAKSYSLVWHTRMHAGEKPYRCQLCPKSFSHKKNLITHVRKHTGEKPYKCKECPKAFAENSTLLRHNRTHTGEKPYKCEQCPKAFTVSSSLLLHTRTHTGEKPYKCKQCPKAFAASSGLFQHTRTHTGEKPDSCQLCPTLFLSHSF